MITSAVLHRGCGPGTGSSDAKRFKVSLYLVLRFLRSKRLNARPSYDLRLLPRQNMRQVGLHIRDVVLSCIIPSSKNSPFMSTDCID